VLGEELGQVLIPLGVAEVGWHVQAAAPGAGEEAEEPEVAVVAGDRERLLEELAVVHRPAVSPMVPTGCPPASTYL
jgi:hypothetical protein